MIEIKHYQHDYSGEAPNLSPLVKDFGKTNTDTSKWRPEISVTRAQAGMLSGRKLLYDFPDGKDTGEFVQTYIRSPGLDITEVESAELRMTQIIEDKKQADKNKSEKDKERQQFKDNIQKLADSVSSTDSLQSSNAPGSSS